MKVVLCGYNWVGCKALEVLLENNCDVFVFTHEAPYYVNDLIAYCEKRNVKYTTDKISKQALPFIPDVVSSIFYRYIISEEVIEACGGRIFNLHPSLLPKYRGCSSLTWAMIDGEKDVGYSYHYLTTQVDGGDIIIQEKMKIEDFDTQISLYFRVMFEAAKKYFEVVRMVAEGYKGEKQDLTKESYYKRGAPFDGVIDASWEERKIERYIRAMIFPPLPVAKFKDKNVYNIDDFKKLKSQ